MGDYFCSDNWRFSRIPRHGKTFRYNLLVLFPWDVNLSITNSGVVKSALSRLDMRNIRVKGIRITKSLKSIITPYWFATRNSVIIFFNTFIPLKWIFKRNRKNVFKNRAKSILLFLPYTLTMLIIHSSILALFLSFKTVTISNHTTQNLIVQREVSRHLEYESCDSRKHRFYPNLDDVYNVYLTWNIW